ncbi:peptidoglycan editing factor PgeF [Paenibacillus hamazuiensis]|uniref:peptidoglycan editing factor PgeF n=1 Tax=Paenibacillus hamazuiensis TaxID=2936508 RepID=UPI00200E8C48|nr:peptidoglycan editing factor PgeF [Paenibacillus hamazuiensis]
MEPFILEKAPNGAELLHITSWAARFPQISAGFTTRRGGVSGEPFTSLNCGLHVSDRPGDVIANREKLAEALGIPAGRATYAEQVHGCDIAVISPADGGKGVYSREEAIQAKDGFITNEPGIFLHALFADCVPLYFYDPVHRAVGLSHAGWKGSVLQIARETVSAMQRAYGSRPSELVAAIGPSIGVCCYEVDDAVIGRVREALEQTGPSAAGNEGEFYISKGNGKHMLNLQHFNRQIMIKAGILPSNIEVSTLCTSCRTDLFFSHRKEGGRTGRMAAWIGIRPLS